MRRGRIIGGTDAADNWPWVAAIEGTTPSGVFLCSGSKIAARWILTAAHCVSDSLDDSVLPPASLRVAVGNGSRTARTDWAVATTIIRYPGWNPSTGTGDLALVRLNRPIDAWSGQIAGAAQEPVPPAAASIVGWGLINEAPDILPDTLQVGSTDIWSTGLCQAAWATFVPAIQFCAGAFTGIVPAVTTCHGDSGGPLSTPAENLDWIVGITSYGSAGGCLALPTVFTRVASYRSWILPLAGLHAPAIVEARATASETSGQVSITYDGGGADTFVSLEPEGDSVPDGSEWRRGEGRQTVPLHTLDLYPGSLYDYTVFADSLYGVAASMPVQVVTTDRHAPSFSVAPVKARAGRVARIGVTATDNSPWIGYLVRVQRGRRTLKTFQHRIGSQPNLALRAHSTLRWRVPRTRLARLRACGYAFDDAGHRSRTVCRKITVSR